MNAELQPDREMARRTRRSFLTGGIAALAGLGAYRWIATRRPDQGIPWPLRRSLEVNEQLARDYFRPARQVPEFAAGSGEMPRVNGTMGIDDEDFDADKWSLQVQGLESEEGEATLQLADIQALPKAEFVTELKCIEGWSTRVRWGGARFADFAKRYPPADKGDDAHVGFETPDGEYYTGIELASAMHPQTLLCYEMDGKPLEEDHGAPLRLVIPVKYGIKNLKRIGRISFTTTRPHDYWAERGYDYYAGF